MRRLIAGISAHYHDSAFALIDADTGQLVFAESEERFSRIKGDSSFPVLAIEKGLKYVGANKSDIYRVGFYEKPLLKMSRIAASIASQLHSGSHRQIVEISRQIGNGRYLPYFKLRKHFPGIPIDFHSHHMSHAASSYFASGFDEATVITVDGVGEWETMTILAGSKGNLKKVSSMKFPHSLGLFYATFTTYCGFKVNSGEYKLMGLAPFGQPRYYDVIKRELIKVKPDRTFELNMKYFDYTRSLSMFNHHFENLFEGSFRVPEEQIDQRICDVAASAQKVLEELYIGLIKNALATTGINNLCLAGGVALNCVANAKIAEVLDLSRVFIQPASGDAGGSLGAGYLSLKKHRKADGIGFNVPKLENVFKGKSYTNGEIRDLLKENLVPFQEFSNLEELDDRLASFLTSGKIVGLFRGRSEFGPRSLGARSIIASASDPQMQRKVNLSIKKRESFRPFAPIVLLEKCHEWFQWPSKLESPYMLFTAPVNSSRLLEHHSKLNSANLTERLDVVRSQIPAVTHIDNSARIQTIANEHPLRKLLELYYQKTRCPVLINTSFNVRGEPIVETPYDALNCFINTEIDLLAIETFLVGPLMNKHDFKSKFDRHSFQND